MMPLIPHSPPMFPGTHVPLFPAIPAPWHQGGAWTSENIYGSPFYPVGMISGQTWSTGPAWGQQWSTSDQTGTWPLNGQFGQNGQWFSSDQNGFNSQWPVNGQNGIWSPNGQNGQWAFSGQNGQWTDQSQFRPNSWEINGQQDTTLTNTDNFGTGMTTGNSNPWGMYRQLTIDSSLRNQAAAGNQGTWNQQTGFNNGFRSGTDQTGWQSIDGSLQRGFQSGIQSINNGLPSSTTSFGSPFGLNLPPWAGKKK
ncbi:fibrinogen alpha-1 chain-like [Dreissena polymorpha]|nr:fibrinogen alpha-1 chain-like [Dreissena polymorpha]